jgi:hypothetical protein
VQNAAGLDAGENAHAFATFNAQLAFGKPTARQAFNFQRSSLHQIHQSFGLCHSL